MNNLINLLICCLAVIDVEDEISDNPKSVNCAINRRKRYKNNKNTHNSKINKCKMSNSIGIEIIISTDQPSDRSKDIFTCRCGRGRYCNCNFAVEDS